MYVMISYSRQDSKFVNRLKYALLKGGHASSVFLDVHEVSLGEYFPDKILAAIYQVNFFIIVITPNSINSPWVTWELQSALRREQSEKKEFVLAILLKGENHPLLFYKVYLDYRKGYLEKKNFEKLVIHLRNARPEFKQLVHAPLVERIVPTEQPVHNQLLDRVGEKADNEMINGDIFNKPDSMLIKSPMVGTFYRSSSPDKPAFAEIGDTVEVGSVVCIVEAMKLFNELESEVKGKVVKVLVEDATPVEYDQELFIIDPIV
ncbi:MAG: hypothetical protein DHS20C18_41110 [Saprospiraceae bacterium]|nr:MAG: hypothetical protein DHS20C18_41110 [Saprospiraceae bacterium]